MQVLGGEGIGAVPVEIVLLQLHGALQHPVGDGVRAGEQHGLRRGAQLLTAYLLHKILAQGVQAAHSNGAVKGVERALQGDLQGQVIQGFHAHLGPIGDLAGIIGRGVLDGKPAVCRRASHIRIQQAVGAVLKVVGGKRLAVRPLQAVPQVEGVDGIVIADLVALGGVVLQLIAVETHQLDLGQIEKVKIVGALAHNGVQSHHTIVGHGEVGADSICRV